jgi:hypothetical protein
MTTDDTVAPKPARICMPRAGGKTGLEHIEKQKNCQDGYLLFPMEANGKRYLVGVVADGCTGERKTSRTEVGSALMVLFVCSEIRQMLTLRTPLSEIPAALYPRCIAFIGNIARLTLSGTAEEMASFIGDFFLCTLLGFVMDDETLVEFASGDGFHVVNERNEVFDRNNASLYMAYHQVDRATLAGNPTLPTVFEHIAEYKVADLKRYAIGTDGLVRHSRERGYYLDPQEVNAMFAYQPKSKAGLKWWLAKRQSEDQAYKDDISIITLTWNESEEHS